MEPGPASEAARYDVAVVGAGSAGVAAAMAAARSGARTLLLEASDRLGGNASLALVHTICGLYLDAEGDRPRLAHPGFPSRVARELQRLGAAGPPERAGRVHYLPIDPTAYAAWLASVTARLPELEVRRRSPLRALTEDPVAGFRLDAEGLAARAELVVDASGAAVAAAALAADRFAEPPETLQCPSYIVELDGIEAGALEGFARLRVTTAVARAVRDGALPPGCESVVVRPGLGPGQAFLTLGVPKPEGRYAPLDPELRAELERGARAAAGSVVAHLRATRAAFAGVRVRAWPEQLGVRESARGGTRVELSRDDVLRGRRREDEVALSTWPIELWREHRRARFEHPEGPCSVPLGALVSRSHVRLGFAGRCMGGSHEALGALRVIGTSLATGEAIGTAAALAADAGVPLTEVRPADVRERIVSVEGRGE